MKTIAKTSLVLIGTLIIGIIIGTIGSTILRRNLMEERAARFKTAEGFTNRLIHVIEPDSSQKKAIEKILFEHHQQVQEISSDFHVQMKSKTDSLLKDLKPILTEEQYDRLEKRLKHRRPFFREGRRKFDRKERD